MCCGFIVEDGLLFPHFGWLCLPLRFGGLRMCFPYPGRELDLFISMWDLLWVCVSPVAAVVKVCLLSSPGIWVAVYATTFLGCYWVVWAMLGPRTTLSHLIDFSCVHPFVWVVTMLSLFPHRDVSCLFYYGMQWLVFGLLRAGLEAGYAWENWCLEPPRQS